MEEIHIGWNCGSIKIKAEIHRAMILPTLLQTKHTSLMHWL